MYKYINILTIYSIYVYTYIDIGEIRKLRK